MGKGYVYKCPGCGKEKELIKGIGFRTLYNAHIERSYILAGIYGPKVQAALVGNPEAAVSVEQDIYQCGACGALESRLAVTVNTPVRITVHQRCNCGAIMHRIRAGKEMLCPSCRLPLTEADIVSTHMWD